MIDTLEVLICTKVFVDPRLVKSLELLSPQCLRNDIDVFDTLENDEKYQGYQSNDSHGIIKMNSKRLSIQHHQLDAEKKKKSLEQMKRKRRAVKGTLANL